MDINYNKAVDILIANAVCSEYKTLDCEKHCPFYISGNGITSSYKCELNLEKEENGISVLAQATILVLNARNKRLNDMEV